MRWSWFLLVAVVPRVALAQGHVALLDAFGTPARFEVRGRILEEEAAHAPSKDRGRLHNLKDALEALDGDGVEGASVHVEVEGLTADVKTGHDGMFVAVFDGATPAPKAAVHQVQVTAVGPNGFSVHGEGPLYLLPDEPLLILVSDVDDTIVQTHVRSRAKLKLADTVLFKNAAQLEPVPGAPLAYRNAVAAGVGAVIYVSGSPQGFHDRIRDYLALQGFPGGPILLKDFSKESPTQQEGYKRRKLEDLAARFPKARFLVAGDSGEKDPEIYRAFSNAFPGRVVGIVIRQTPAAPASRERLTGCRVVQDHVAQPQLLADLARRALAPPTTP